MNIKSKTKSYIISFLLGAIIFSFISVTAVTYFPSNEVTYNKNSGLNSTNVQDALDELYNTCSSSVSLGNYLYYAVNSYSIDDSGSFNFQDVIASGASLFRCSSSGDNCTAINSYNNRQSIGVVYSTSNYLYYTVNNYTFRDGSFGEQYVIASGTSLFRCNSNGENCTAVNSYNGSQSINNMYSTKDYLYYAVNSYSISNSGSFNFQDVIASGASLYRCNLDGENCTVVNSYNGNQSISNVGV